MFEVNRTPEALLFSFQGRADSLASAAPYSCRAPMEWRPNYSFELGPDQSIRLLFGRPDAADPSRFSVSYEYGGKQGCLQFVVAQNGVQLVDGDFLLRWAR